MAQSTTDPLRLRNKAYVAAIRSRTVCAECGAQPIDWHHEDHPQHPHERVAKLATNRASIERIQREIDRCTPLCRRCHMRLDGRTGRTAAINRARVARPRQCSACPTVTKDIVRGFCPSCYRKCFRTYTPTGRHPGRQIGSKNAAPRDPQTVARGDRNGNTRLNGDAVRTIRAMAAQGEPQRALAARYGLSESAVSAIVLRRTWRHVT